MLSHDCEGEIVAIAGAVAGLQVVTVHIHKRAVRRLLNVPLIGVAAVFLITPSSPAKIVLSWRRALPAAMEARPTRVKNILPQRSDCGRHRVGALAVFEQRLNLRPRFRESLLARRKRFR